MRVGIIEIMETGHIVLAETLCRIFCSDTQNQVFLFTIETHFENIKFLDNQYPNLTLIVKPSQKDVRSFLNEVGAITMDRIYIVTMIKYFREFSDWQIHARLFLIIHNLDEWFEISFTKGIRKFIYSALRNPGLKLMIYFFKTNIIYYRYKKRILDKVRLTNGRIVVLSESVGREVRRLNIQIPVDVIPFSVFNPALSGSGVKHDPEISLKICVPGVLSQYRRNYLGFLDLIEKQLAEYKPRFVVDFLGGALSDNPLDNSELILTRIEQLKTKGFSITVHPVRFITPPEYDRYLAEADIIVGNMNVVLNKFSSYGKTKETGLPFAMIKAAKPGILPDSYPMPEEIVSSTITYHELQDLGKIIRDLINDPEKLLSLKQKALENSKHFSPEIIYRTIIAEK